MIVAGFPRRIPVAHGKSIDHLVVERRITQRRICWRFAGRIVARRRQEGASLAVDTKPRLRSEIDQSLGVDRACQMIVQVTALGDLPQEAETDAPTIREEMRKRAIRRTKTSVALETRIVPASPKNRDRDLVKIPNCAAGTVYPVIFTMRKLHPHANSSLKIRQNARVAEKEASSFTRFAPVL